MSYVGGNFRMKGPEFFRTEARALPVMKRPVSTPKFHSALVQVHNWCISCCKKNSYDTYKYKRIKGTPRGPLASTIRIGEREIVYIGKIKEKAGG